MKTILALLLTVIVTLSGLAHAELSPEQKREIDIEMSRAMAAKAVVSLSKLEQQVGALSQDDRELALGFAAGSINAKIGRWADQHVMEGKYTRQQVAHITSHALMRLALLAQTANFPQAALCHYRESAVLRQIGEGRQADGAACRQTVYSPEVQARGIRDGANPDVMAVTALINKWSTEAVLYSIDLAIIDGFGKGTPPPAGKSEALDVVPLLTQYAGADRKGQLAICAPILTKFASMAELSFRGRMRARESVTRDEMNNFFQIAYRADIVEQAATVQSPVAHKKAWEDSAADKTLGIRSFAVKCLEGFEVQAKEGRFDVGLMDAAKRKTNERIKKMAEESTR